MTTPHSSSSYFEGDCFLVLGPGATTMNVTVRGTLTVRCGANCVRLQAGLYDLRVRDDAIEVALPPLKRRLAKAVEASFIALVSK